MRAVSTFPCLVDRFEPYLSLLFSFGNFFFNIQKIFGIYEPKDGTCRSDFEASSGTAFLFLKHKSVGSTKDRQTHSILPPTPSTTECSLFKSQSQPSGDHKERQNHQVHSYSVLTCTLMYRNFCLKYGEDTQHFLQGDCVRNLEE